MNKVTFDQETVKRMIDEAVRAEREACAILAKQFGGEWAEDAIRARGQA